MNSFERAWVNIKLLYFNPIHKAHMSYCEGLWSLSVNFCSFETAGISRKLYRKQVSKVLYVNFGWILDLDAMGKMKPKLILYVYLF